MTNRINILQEQISPITPEDSASQISEKDNTQQPQQPIEKRKINKLIDQLKGFQQKMKRIRL